MTEQATVEKTLIIKSRGRKYFTCITGKVKAKLVINPVSTGLELDRIVHVRAVDLSTRSKFGADLIFEALEILSDTDAKAAYEAATKRNEAAKWMGYAEGDALGGMSATNAIIKALSLSKDMPELAERRAALVARTDKNAEQYKATLAARDKARAEETAKRQAQARQRVLYPVRHGPAMNVPVRRGGGKVVVFESTGKAFRISEDDPSVHGSQLLGHEGEQGCYYYYRPATEAEVAELEASEARAEEYRQAKQQAKQTVERIKATIQAGERPDGQHNPEGDELLDTRTIYGNGSWFVVGAAWIWYCQNNGGDGDCWEANNVITGGAGAIGWRIPFDQAMADELVAINNDERGKLWL